MIPLGVGTKIFIPPPDLGKGLFNFSMPLCRLLHPQRSNLLIYDFGLKMSSKIYRLLPQLVCRSGTSQVWGKKKKKKGKVLMNNTNFLYDGCLPHQRRDWCVTVSVCFPARSRQAHYLHIISAAHTHLEADETPVSIVSCSAEASKNQLRQKYSVNIKGTQRGFCFWWWIIIIINLSTEVERRK